MDSARKAEIRARWNGVVPDPWIAAERDVADLLAEVKRLEAKIEVLGAHSVGCDGPGCAACEDLAFVSKEAGVDFTNIQ